MYGFEPFGLYGELVNIEVDIRRGLPFVDIVGLPDNAIKEARERIRAGIRNAGFEFPMDRVLISLSPAGLRKSGSQFDLPMALSLLSASSQIPRISDDTLALGELELSGNLVPVNGILSAVTNARNKGFRGVFVPEGNYKEAMVVEGIEIWPLTHLRDAAHVCSHAFSNETRSICVKGDDRGLLAADTTNRASLVCDFSSFKGQPLARRALEVAAAGNHHVLLFGPPGSGKTMAARCLAGIMPKLDAVSAMEAATMYSLAGITRGFSLDPVCRAPHHSTSAEGLIGGGRQLRPGELSLAHGGLLFLDETPEFRSDVLQALREPLESGVISLSRANKIMQYPARILLAMAANLCPCGNLGKSDAVCLCTRDEIRRYWKKLSGALLDRIDIRLPLKPAAVSGLLQEEKSEPSLAIAARVSRCRELQRERYRNSRYTANGFLDSAGIDKHLKSQVSQYQDFFVFLQTEGFSSRAIHSVIKLARTIADMEALEVIQRDHLEEAYTFRKYGEADWYWTMP